MRLRGCRAASYNPTTSRPSASAARRQHARPHRWRHGAAVGLRHLSSASKGLGDHDDISGLLYRFGILHTEALARFGDIDAAVTSLEATRGSRHPAYQYVESGYLLAAAWVSAVRGYTT